MWRFTPNKVSLGLAAQRAVLGVVRAAARIDEYVMPHAAQVAGAAATMANPVSAATTAAPAAAPSLRNWLAAQPLARASVNISVANVLTHHLLVTKNRAVAHYRERDGYARAMVEEAFGLDGSAWHIAADDDPFAAQFLAVAMPRSTLDDARAGLAAARAKARSVQSFFTREWNTWRKPIGTAPCWFVVIEPDCAMVARVQRGRIASLRTLRGAVESPAALVRDIEREALMTLCTAAPRTVCVTGEALFAQASLTLDGYTLHRPDAAAPAPFAGIERARARLLWSAW